MKNYLKICRIILIITLFLLNAGNAFAWVALPTLSIKGGVRFNSADTQGAGNFMLEGCSVAQITYRDGSFTNSNTKLESMINAEVIITDAKRSGDYTFSDAKLLIRDSSFIYLEADLVNISFVTDGSSWYMNPEMDVADGSTMNLKNIKTNVNLTHPSLYIEELNESVRFINKAAFRLIVSPAASTDIKGDFSGNISSALLASPLYLSSPIGVRTKEYWEKHYIERGIFGYDAVSDNLDLLNIFSDTESFDTLFMKEKSKTLLDEAKTQLAVLLLNIAAGLDPSTAIRNSFNDHELSRIPQTAGSEDSVKDAVMDIEKIIKSSKSKSEIERVKNLAESINNTIF
jgi:hypothetical protein